VINRIASRRPQPDEVASKYQRDLIDRVAGECALKVLEQQQYWLCELGSFISVEQMDKTHPPYTWTIRQVFEHCADAERVFGYRMLRLAAGDTTELPGFDENQYASSRFGLGNFSRLIHELGLLRGANLLLLRRIVPRAWDRCGRVAGAEISVRGLGWLAAGHLQHHLEIVERRCGVQVPREPPESPG